MRTRIAYINYTKKFRIFNILNYFCVVYIYKNIKKHKNIKTYISPKKSKIFSPHHYQIYPLKVYLPPPQSLLSLPPQSLLSLPPSIHPLDSTPYTPLLLTPPPFHFLFYGLFSSTVLVSVINSARLLPYHLSYRPPLAVLLSIRCFVTLTLYNLTFHFITLTSSALPHYFNPSLTIRLKFQRSNAGVEPSTFRSPSQPRVGRSSV